jgi:hypothetical protein
MNASPASSPAPALPLALRVLRAVILLALCAALAFVFVLGSFALLNPMTMDDDHFRVAVTASLGLGGLLLPVLLVWLAYRLRLRSWWWLGGGWLAVLPVLAYLAADDPVIRRPMTIEEVAPSFPGAEQSYQVLMVQAVDSPAARAFKTGAFSTPKDIAELPAYAGKNRARVEDTWHKLAAERAWYAELNAFDRIGDLGDASHETPIPAYAVHRVMAQTAQLKALLLAGEGRGDEAVAVLLPVLEVGRKIQVTSRTLVRTMIGFTIRRMALDAAGLVLDRTAVSPAMRARLLAAAGPVSGEAGARRLVAIEYANWTTGSMIDYHLNRKAESPAPAVLRGLVGLFTPLVINPNRTINEAGDIMAELQDLAARRQPMTLARRVAPAPGPVGIKNLIGQLMVYSEMPAYQYILDRYWETEDKLVALRGRLAED